MPYRSLPNSDVSRFRALNVAMRRLSALGEGEAPPFSAATRAALEGFFPGFRKEYQDLGPALQAQTSATSGVSAQTNKVRDLVRDFLVVFFRGIKRGAAAAEDRHFYGLGTDQETLPEMGTRESVREWALKIVEGETARVAAGGRPMDWPSAVEISEALAAFDPLEVAQTEAAAQFDQEQEDLEALRLPADNLIRDIWDEVEFAYRHDDPSSLRRKARRWGVYYQPRPGEAPEEGIETGGDPPEGEDPAA